MGIERSQNTELIGLLRTNHIHYTVTKAVIRPTCEIKKSFSSYKVLQLLQTCRPWLYTCKKRFARVVTLLAAKTRLFLLQRWLRVKTLYYTVSQKKHSRRF